MPSYNQMPIRLQADLISAPPVVPIDQNTGLPIKFWRAQEIQFAVGVFDNTGAAVDLSNLIDLQIIIQESQSSLVPSLSKTAESGDIIPVITRAEWESGQNQQALFQFTSAETDFSLGAQSSKTYWLLLVGHPLAGGSIVYAAGPVTIFNPGWTLPPPPMAITSWNSQVSSVGNVVVTPTTQIHSENITITSGETEPSVRNVIVGVAGLAAGAHIDLRFTLPAIEGTTIRIYALATTGELLATLTTQSDGFLPTSLVQLRWNGVELKRWELAQPAFGQQG